MEQMTPEQAIQEIRYYMNSDCYLDAPSNDACKLAISALEKQVPKKPNVDKCPNCGNGDIEIWMDGGYMPHRYTICPDCGQAINWSE